MTVETLLLAFGLFQIKHFVADFVLQSAGQIRSKAQYGHPLGLLHAAIHGAATAPLLVWLGADAGPVLPIIAAELVLHYHLDWAKEKLTTPLSLSPGRAPYWYLFGFDQLLHQPTYVAILWWMV